MLFATALTTSKAPCLSFTLLHNRYQIKLGSGGCGHSLGDLPQSVILLRYQLGLFRPASICWRAFHDRDHGSVQQCTFLIPKC